MKVTLTWTAPTTRVDGTPLTLAEIASFNIFRNGNLLATSPAPTAEKNTFDDTSPLAGADAYTVETLTTDGLTSAPSNVATVTVVIASPAQNITDLAAVLVTP